MSDNTSGPRACLRISPNSESREIASPFSDSALALPLFGDCTITAAVDATSDEWRRRVSAGTLSEQTSIKAISLAQRFQRFAAAHELSLLDAVDDTIISRFVNSRGRNRHGAIAPAAPATRRNRLSGMRLFFSTARYLRLTVNDPTRNIVVPARTLSRIRPVTAEEAETLRFVSDPERGSRHAATLAMLLAGAHTAELGHIAAVDFRSSDMQLFAHGSSKHRERWVDLDVWATEAIDRRLTFLRQHDRTGLSNPTICTGASGTCASKQARVCVTARELITRAGLSTDSAIKPASLTAYAARETYIATGSLLAAARTVGAVSLDTTARQIALDWKGEATS